MESRVKPALLIMAISHDIAELKTKVDAIADFIANGDDISLPARQVSVIAEKLRDELASHAIILEKLQTQTNKLTIALERLDQDAVRARNQVVYMFVVIIATLVGKVIIGVITGS